VLDGILWPLRTVLPGRMFLTVDKAIETAALMLGSNRSRWMENTPSPSGGSVGTRSSTASGPQHSCQWSGPLVPREEQSSLSRTFQCLLQIARTADVA
jgi:hypothetical protein